MNLVIDIGNKKVKIGIFKKGKIIKFCDSLTSSFENFYFPEEWKNFKIERCGISSVVPDLNSSIEKKIKDFFNIEPLFLTYKNCGIKIKIRNPEKVGIDRIVNCKGASEIFGYPVIIIDIGTGTTIDIVDKNKNFIGGFILPGPELWIDSLKKTSLIKEIKFKIGKFIGKDTSSAIYLGLKYGLSGAIEKIIYKFKEVFEEQIIVLTGGYSFEFKELLNFKKKLRPYLTLEGINIILNEYEKN
ncbi:MAG: type III pantothenate kinase [Candidatus Omnitrophica bacterium]|nr:type III pantothenate kinase [Candidatus Omnitrophota bacterium]